MSPKSGIFCFTKRQHWTPIGFEIHLLHVDAELIVLFHLTVDVVWIDVLGQNECLAKAMYLSVVRVGLLPKDGKLVAIEGHIEFARFEPSIAANFHLIAHQLIVVNVPVGICLRHPGRHTMQKVKVPTELIGGGTWMMIVEFGW